MCDNDDRDSDVEILNPSELRNKYFGQQIALIKQLRDSKERIPRNWKHFKEFVLKSVAWEPSTELIQSVWKKMCSVEDKVSGQNPSPFVIEVSDDDNESEECTIIGYEPPPRVSTKIAPTSCLQPNNLRNNQNGSHQQQRPRPLSRVGRDLIRNKPNNLPPNVRPTLRKGSQQAEVTCTPPARLQTNACPVANRPLDVVPKVGVTPDGKNFVKLIPKVNSPSRKNQRVKLVPLNRLCQATSQPDTSPSNARLTNNNHSNFVPNSRLTPSNNQSVKSGPQVCLTQANNQPRIQFNKVGLTPANHPQLANTECRSGINRTPNRPIDSALRAGQAPLRKLQINSPSKLGITPAIGQQANMAPKLQPSSLMNGLRQNQVPGVVNTPVNQNGRLQPNIAQPTNRVRRRRQTSQGTTQPPSKSPPGISPSSLPSAPSCSTPSTSGLQSPQPNTSAGQPPVIDICDDDCPSPPTDSDRESRKNRKRKREQSSPMSEEEAEALRERLLIDKLIELELPNVLKSLQNTIPFYMGRPIAPPAVPKMKIPARKRKIADRSTPQSTEYTNQCNLPSTIKID